MGLFFDKHKGFKTDDGNIPVIAPANQISLNNFPNLYKNLNCVIDKGGASDLLRGRNS